MRYIKDEDPHGLKRISSGQDRQYGDLIPTAKDTTDIEPPQRPSDSRPDQDGSLQSKELSAQPGDGSSGDVPQKENRFTRFGQIPARFDQDKKQSTAKITRRRAIIASILLLIATGGVSLVLLVPALAMRTLITKTTDYFFDRAAYIADRRVDKYVQGYVLDVIGASIDECGNDYITKNCRSTKPGQGKFSKLYTAWRDARIEERWARDYGITFQKDPGKPGLRIFKTEPNGLVKDLGEFGPRSSFRALTDAVDGSTKRKNIIRRMEIKGLLRNKYGQDVHCFIACESRDRVSGNFFERKSNLKARWGVKIGSQFQGRARVFIIGKIAGTSPDQLDRAIKEAGENALDIDTERALRELVDKLDGRTISKYLVDDLIIKVFEKLGIASASSTATAAIPVAGQVYAGLSILELVAAIDEAIETNQISNFIYSTNAALAATEFTAMNALNDDITSGEADYADVAGNFALIAGFDKSRVYQNITGSENLGTTECEEGVILSGNDDPLVCEEDRLRPTTLIERWRDSDFVSLGLDSALSYYKCRNATVAIAGNGAGEDLCEERFSPRYFIKPTLQTINAVTGAVGGFIFDNLASGFGVLFPGLDPAIDFISSWAERAGVASMEWITEHIITPAFSADAEGAEKGTQFAAAADFVANDYTGGTSEENSSGSSMEGRNLSYAEEAALQTEINQEKREELKNQSFFARYFDLDNPYSLATTVALEPVKYLDVEEQKLLTPRVDLSNFASLFTATTSAATPLTVQSRQELFGVPQMGFSLAELETDPKTLTDERCAELARLREETSTVDPDTGAKIYTVGNICTTDDMQIDVLTKRFNLDEEGTAPNVSKRFVNMDEFLRDKRQDTTNVPCAPGAASESIAPIGDGTNRIRLCNYGYAVVNSAWSTAVTAMVEAARQDGIEISGGGYRTAQGQINVRRSNCGTSYYDIYQKPANQCSPPTARPGTSNHELGLAIDVTSITRTCGLSATVCPADPAFRWLVANAGQFGIKKLNSEAWHFSIDGK